MCIRDRFNSDLAKAQKTLDTELPGAIAEANAAFGKAQKQLSMTSPGKIGGNITAGANNPLSTAKNFVSGKFGGA